MRFDTLRKPAARSCVAARAAHAALAVDHDLARGIERAECRRERPQRHEPRAGELCDRPLVRLPHVDEVEVVAPLDASGQLRRGHLAECQRPHSCPRRSGRRTVRSRSGPVIVACRRTPGSAGSLRSSASRNCMRSASNRSSRPISGSPMPRMSLIASVAWITPISPGSTPSTPPSAQLGTSPGGGGSRIEAAIARAVLGREHRRLSVEAEDAAVHVRLPEQHAGVVHQVARREVVGAVDDDVVVAR